MRHFSLLFMLSLCFGLFASANTVIPEPAESVFYEGRYVLPSVLQMTKLNATQSAVFDVFVKQMQGNGVDLKCKFSAKGHDIKFLRDKKLKNEGYCLQVDAKGIKISASDDSGYFYALQTLSQLVDSTKSIRYCKITDSPRFGYRGLMLDVSRCFVPKDEVLRIIDVATQLKINRLHLHLVDDNGWRIEIKRYPKLTEVGAWRAIRDEAFPYRKNPRQGEPTTVGGFYTQQDLRDIVAYAQDRAMTIVPEIEMPAHSVSALASYPELACPVVKDFIGVLPGIGGKNSEIVYCAGNEKVFTFIKNVLDEVMDIFPSKYIHIGGDEASVNNWSKCPLCNKRVADEHLKGVDELQGYFIRKINDYIKSKGRKTMAWDEVADSNLGDDITLFGWRGDGSAAVKGAEKGQNFVMTPAKTLYLIRYQGPQWFEPYTYFGNNTLQDVYSYEPIRTQWSDSVKSKLMGIQGSLWTEFCTTPKDVEYLLFPRVMALADVSWRKEGCGDWSKFLTALDAFLMRLDKKQITYAQSMFNIDHKVEGRDGALAVTLTCIRPDVEIRYTKDGSNPTNLSPKCDGTITVGAPCAVKAATFVGGVQKGKTLTLALNHNKATCKPVKSSPDVASLYVLTNGLRGSERHSDFEWAGWYNQDAAFTVDLEKDTHITSIKLGTISNIGMGVKLPSEVAVYTSADGQNFTLQKTVEFDDCQMRDSGIRTEDVDFGHLEIQARYVKFAVKNGGKIPVGTLREGQSSWMYFDEISIN